jgi:hypothetical protein
VPATPLDAARDGLIELQGQLIGVLAVQNAALAQRVQGRRLWRAAGGTLAEVLVTARADRGPLEPGDQAYGGCRPGGKLRP